MTMSKAFEKPNQKRRPKRTVKELSEELGVSHQKLSGLLSRDGAPKAAVSHRSSTGMKTWFDPEEVLAWFKGLPK